MEDLNKIIGENLKRERINSGYTQKQIADKIGYSEKSVSKWEAGLGLPGVDTLIEMCKIFNTDISSVVVKKENEPYYLAIDGGGTKTHYLLCNSEGSIVKEHIGECTNPIDIGIDNTKRILKQNINMITYGICPGSIYTYAGISGGTTGTNREILHEFFESFGFAKFENDSDIMSAVSLGLDKSNGMIIIMGTGVVGFAIKDGYRKQIGGWGQLFDAGGGSYNLGKDALYAVLREDDGTGEKTLLKPAIEEILGTSVRKALSDIYQKGKKYIASFSKTVTEVAAKGDKVANEIIGFNMLEVAKIINAGLNFVEDKNVKVAFIGSLILNNRSFVDIIKQNLNPDYNIEFIMLDKAPVYGALQLAKELNQ